MCVVRGSAVLVLKVIPVKCAHFGFSPFFNFVNGLEDACAYVGAPSQPPPTPVHVRREPLIIPGEEAQMSVTVRDAAGKGENKHTNLSVTRVGSTPEA